MANWDSKWVLTASVAVLALLAALAIALGVFYLTSLSGGGASIKSAEREVDAGQYSIAAATLTQLIKAKPDDILLLLARARCHMRAQHHELARKDYEHILAIAPGNARARLGLAELMRLQGKLQDALSEAKNVAQLDPNLAEAQAALGRIYYGLFQDNARDCIRIIEDRPKTDLGLTAATEIRRGLFGPVREYYRNYFGKDPASATRSQLNTLIDTSESNYRAAVASLRSAVSSAEPSTVITDESDRAATALLLGAILFESGDYDGSWKILERALDMRGVDRVQAVMIQAEILSERASKLVGDGVVSGNTRNMMDAERLNAQAIGLLEGLVKDHPNVYAVRDKLAMHYVRAGMFDKAQEQSSYSIKGSRSAEARYVQGIVYLANGQYDSAISEFLSIQERMQNEPRFYFSLGLAYYQKGGATASSSLAASAFRRVIDLRPNFVPARLRLAKLYLREGWYDEAKEQCTQILAIPNRPAKLDAQVYLMLSEANRGLKDYGEVLTWLNRAVKESPSENALMAQAFLMIEQGMEDDVLRQYESGQLADQPTSACIRGYAYLKKGMPDKAVENFKKALLLDKQYIMGYVHLAVAYESLNRIDDAAAEYEKAIKMTSDLRLPPNAGLHFGLAMLLVKAGKFDAAEKQFREVIKINPDHAAARLRLAALSLRKRNFDDALQEVNYVIRANPSSAEAYFLNGLIYSMSARRPVDDLRRDIASRRNLKIDVIDDRIMEAERRLYLDHAVENYEKAIELDPRFRLSYEVAVIYAVQGQYDKMASVYLRALGVAPPASRPELLQRLSIAYLCSRNYDKAQDSARKALDEASQLATRDANNILRFRYTLINCLIACGEFEKAREEITKTQGDIWHVKDAYLDLVQRLMGYKLKLQKDQQADLNTTIGSELNLGLLYSGAGVIWLPYAERAYLGVLALDKDNMVAMRYLSDLYIVTRQLDKARQINKRLLEISPRFAPALRNLAAIEEFHTRSSAASAPDTETKLAAQAAAIDLYRQAIAAAPDTWLPKLELASIYQRAGKNDEAMRLYEEVIKLNPTQIEALNDYANLCAEERVNIQEAVELAKRAKELDPLSGAVLDTFGVLLTLSGDTNGAVEQLEQAQYLMPGHPTVMYHLAIAYSKTGRKEKALELLVALKDAQFPEKYEAEQLRQSLEK